MSNIINILQQENLLDCCTIQEEENGILSFYVYPQSVVLKDLDRMNEIFLDNGFLPRFWPKLIEPKKANPLILKYIKLPKPVEI
jgi:hypothetical protein